MCEIEDAYPVPNQFIQIAADEDEINRRIQCFVEKKRDEIDLCNIMDFTNVKQRMQDNTSEDDTPIRDEENIDDENESMTCARVNSTVVKQEYSKCHLKGKDKYTCIICIQSIQFLLGQCLFEFSELKFKF